MKKYLLTFQAALMAGISIVTLSCGAGQTGENNAKLRSAAPAATNWTIDQYQVSVNGESFFANGVSYSPVPWGSCSAFNPYGDFTINTWSSVWQRDLALMRANGINMLKTYNTLDSAQLVAAGNPPTWDHDHSMFLNSCWNNGQDPVYVMMGYAPPKNNMSIFLSSTWSSPANVTARAAIKTNLVNLAAEWGSYPAVMGFVLANEINADNVVNNSAFFTYWNDVANAMQAVAPGKLVTLANVDDGMITVDSGNTYMTATNFFWGYNSYRGNWTNSNGFDALFSTFQTATAGNPHPLMLTEWGAPASTHVNGQMANLSSLQMQNLATYVTGHYNNMLANRSDGSSGVCCGGAYFEWTDEWWKADPAGMECNAPAAAPACHTGIWDTSAAQVAGFPGGYWDEEGFGLYGIAPVNSSGRQPVVPGGCIGPWNPSTNSPYSPDVLTVRAQATALFNAMSAGNQQALKAKK